MDPWFFSVENLTSDLSTRRPMSEHLTLFSLMRDQEFRKNEQNSN